MKNWRNSPFKKKFEDYLKISPQNTQTSFAKVCGISKSILSQYLNDKRIISNNHIVFLCERLNCKISDLVEFKEEK